MNTVRLMILLLITTCVMHSQVSRKSAKTQTAEPAVSGTVMHLTSDVPAQVIKRFEEDYPAYTPVWSKEGYNYRADYIDEKNMSGMAVYNANGRMLRSETELQANSYPGSIGDYHTSNLPRRRYKVYSTRDTTGNKGYYSATEEEMLLFDSEGNYKSRINKQRIPSKETK